MTTVFKTSEKSPEYRLPWFTRAVLNRDGSINRDLTSDLATFSNSIKPVYSYYSTRIDQWIEARGYIRLPDEETEEDRELARLNDKGVTVVF